MKLCVPLFTPPGCTETRSICSAQIIPACGRLLDSMWTGSPRSRTLATPLWVTENIGNLGKWRQSPMLKAWHTHGNMLPGGAEFYPLLPKGHWFSVMGMAKCRRLAGKPSEGGYIIIDPIHPQMRSMTWNCYRSSAQRATLLSCNLIRPIPPSIMVAVSFTNIRTVLPTFPRQKTPSWQA